MVTLREVLAYENVQEAVQFLQNKTDGCGFDGMRLSELPDYVKMNRHWFRDYWSQNEKKIGIVKVIEILSYGGKKRKIFLLNSLDRLIGRMLCQVIQPEMEKFYSPHCHSYREDYSITSAVMELKEHVESGKEFLVSIDIQDYFQSVDHQLLKAQVDVVFEDRELAELVWAFVGCDVFEEGKTSRNTKGLITGANVSPLLANLFLTELDHHLSEENISFIRFSDDYFLVADNMQNAVLWKDYVVNSLREKYHLQVNRAKTTISDVFHKKILGYFFTKMKNGSVTAYRSQRSKIVHHHWNESVLEKKQDQYHLINDGILSKKDWTILFENEQNKNYLPVEVVDTLNVHSNVIFNSNVFEYLNQKRITVNLFDKYGNVIGRFIPETSIKPANLLVKQVQLYMDPAQRLLSARQMEIGALHNLRSNLRYYNKKRESEKLEEAIRFLSECIQNINQLQSVNEMMMTEARARQKYYACFDEIILSEDFIFISRTKRPPKDPINALLSFGNVFLYNEIATIIHKTSLDIRISVIHSATNKNASLNLDLADIFKPIIVDRVIFSLVNRCEIRASDHFVKVEKDGVYLNAEGKMIFVRALENKLEQKLMVKNEPITYRQIIQEEVYKWLRTVKTGEAYKPYKYS